VHVKFEVLTFVTVVKAIIWDVTLFIMETSVEIQGITSQKKYFSPLYTALLASCSNMSSGVLFITTKLLDFVHRPDFYKQKTQRFGNWICFRLQVRKGGHLLYRKTKSLPFHRRCQNKRR
jgi:hypothetical protein